jgi:tRNA-dihydrouridine synthase 1
MVDQSELAFRLLCKRYGATLGYTPMLHSRMMIENPTYMRDHFTTCTEERPVIAQVGIAVIHPDARYSVTVVST